MGDLELAGEGDGSVSERGLTERQRVCWERAVAQLGGEPLAIPCVLHWLEVVEIAPIAVLGIADPTGVLRVPSGLGLGFLLLAGIFPLLALAVSAREAAARPAVDLAAEVPLGA